MPWWDPLDLVEKIQTKQEERRLKIRIKEQLRKDKYDAIRERKIVLLGKKH